MVKKKTAIIVTVCVAVVVCILTVGVTLNWALGYMESQRVVVGESDYSLLDRIKGMFASYGLETPDEEDLLLGAAHGMVAGSGDKYAQYFTAEEYAAYTQEQTGNYVGIGVTVQQNTETGGIVITHVIAHSPAAEAGIVPGDVITSVDGEDVTGLDIEELSDRVKGEEDSDVTVEVLPSDGTTQQMTMTRRAVVEDRVTSKMVSDTVGYIRITEFAGSAADQFMSQTKELVKQGAKGLVLDLRYNPGGDKDIVCSIADALFPSGPIIIRENRQGNRQVDYSDSSCLNIPLVVLANEYSASASELLIGGIQDYEVGTFIGTTTYGKGVVQSFIPMSDGESVMKLTTDRYLTPKERSIQDIGCTPDIELEPSEELAANPILMGTEKDNQLEAALEHLAGQLQ